MDLKKMTQEELEKEQQELVQMHKSGEYKSKEIVKKSQKVDLFVSELMRRMLDKNKDQ